MGNILDNMNCNYTSLVENPHCNRNTFSTLASAFLFFTGWWIILDVAAENYVASGNFSNRYYTCGVFGTIAFIMINSVTNSQMRDEGFTDGGCCGPRAIRFWLFIGIVMGFSSVIASIWIFFEAYLKHKGTETEKNVWPSLALVLQNFFILIASYIYKFGRSEELWG